MELRFAVKYLLCIE